MHAQLKWGKLKNLLDEFLIQERIFFETKENKTEFDKAAELVNEELKEHQSAFFTPGRMTTPVYVCKYYCKR